uniref:AMP-dependent synthetase/ligase domain-containing protein n=1 Tax=Anopheles farauti TaxID=69004 RepID=A0A182Q0L1_9DIPT
MHSLLVVSYSEEGLLEVRSVVAMANQSTRYDPETRTWYGPSKTSVFNPEASIGQMIYEILQRSPDRVMQIDIDTGRSMTYAEFRTRLVRFAQNLTAIGVRQGDVVTLANANSENLAPLACALLTIGAPMNPLAPSFNEDDMANMLRTTKPKLVFCDDNNYEVVRNALGKVVTNKDQMPPLYVLESDREDVKHAEDLLKETGQEDQFITKTADLSSVRTWILGGGFIPEKLRDRIDAMLAPTGGRTMCVYGLSETGRVTMDAQKRKPKSVGSLVYDAVVRIVDDNGNRLGVGESGEILVQTAGDHGSYYGNEDASLKAKDANGFFQSGDIGFFDDEGYLYIVDRKKDIFKYRNFYISPTDLEAIISQIEGVLEVCVVGIKDENLATDVPAVAIVRLPGALSLDATQVHKVVDEQVSDYKRLRGGVFFVEELPKTHNGKIVRRKVAEMIQKLNSETNLN